MIKIIRNSYFMSEVLISCLDRNDINVESINDIYPEYPSAGKRSVFRKIFYQRFFPMALIFILYIKKRFFYPNRDGKDKTVLYFAIDDFYYLSKLLRRNFTTNNHVLWLWNPCFSFGCNELDVKLKLWTLKLFGVKIYTFDINDSLKYKINYHNQLYSSKLIKNRSLDSSNKYNKSVFFAGADKGRLSILLKLEKVFSKSGLKSNFFILNDKDLIKKQYDSINYIDGNMSYDEYLEHCSNSEYILEITQDGQSGITLRTLESAFLKKKLITSNKNIINSDLYISNNIFIIDWDNTYLEKDLIEFSRKPFIPYSDDVLDAYEISSFINIFSKK